MKEQFNIGAITPNEARKENNRPRLENGDEAFVQVNVQTLKRAIENPVSSNKFPEEEKKLPIEEEKSPVEEE